MKISNRYWFRTGSTLLMIGSMAIGLSSVSPGQDKDEANQEKKTRIRIVDRDGQELSPKIVVGEAVADGPSPNGVLGGMIQITNDNGLITIRDQDGKEHTIKANSMIVSQSHKTTVENGEEKTEVVKKAIVVDADGKTYEIDLSGDGQLGLTGGPVVMGQTSLGKYMIGVVAQPVSEALADQLNLESGKGLVIAQVTPGSPAAKAELKQNDVLLFADQKALSSVEELVEAVQKAGEANEPLTLTLVRDDKETTVEVTPTSRNMAMFEHGPEGMAMLRLLDPAIEANMQNMMEDFNFGWAQAGPGFVFEPKDFDPEAIRAQVEKMQEQHRMNLDRMKEAFELRNEARKLREEAAEKAVTSDQINELMNEIKRLREEIESLKKEKQ